MKSSSVIPQINTLLVANRGEIAIRVMRTAQRLGIRTVAVYSEADAGALHVRMSDEAICIGPAAATDSYLSVERVMHAVEASQADAVHPGYGFLSENTAFAERLTEAGVIFVGPSAQAITEMGDKAKARQRMQRAGVPCIPGYDGPAQDAVNLRSEASRIGYPLMIKAVAGGGGRGMRLVKDAGEFDESMAMARSESERSFGSGALFLERAIVNARHVEIQVFADQHGTCVHLGERDCSTQRRHQKVLEESPCGVVDPQLRQAMGEQAIAAAKAVGYEGAGTVEFLLDSSSEFYFLEMNTRLQVEHPVTEMITGLDLVEWQLRVAAGQQLPSAFHSITTSGHAIEARLCAEEPAFDFRPASGDMLEWKAPDLPGVRVDSGVTRGSVISPHYDSMMAKIIAHGETREIARQRLQHALRETIVFGVRTNRDYLLALVGSAAFADGRITTDFIDHQAGQDLAIPQEDDALVLKAAVIDYRASRRQHVTQSSGVSPELLDWSNTGTLSSVMTYILDDGPVDVTVTALGDSQYTSCLNDREVTMRVEDVEDNVTSIRINGKKSHVHYQCDSAHVWVATDQLTHGFQRWQAGDAADDQVGSGVLRAPMHGTVVDVKGSVGDVVAIGDVIAVMEAMKMQHTITADVAGRVVDISVEAGAQLGAGDAIATIEPDGES